MVRAVQGTPSLEELKLQYYRLNIQFHQQEHNYLEICRCYRAIYDTPSIVADDSAWKQVRNATTLPPAFTKLDRVRRLTCVAKTP